MKHVCMIEVRQYLNCLKEKKLKFTPVVGILLELLTVEWLDSSSGNLLETEK